MSSTFFMLLQIGEAVLFVFVPFLLLLAPFHRIGFTKAACAWAAACMIFVAIYVIFVTNLGVARYFFPTAILLACYAGGGASVIATFLSAKISSANQSRYRVILLLGITVLICSVTFFKLAGRGRKSFIGDFAALLEQSGKHVELYSVDSSIANKVVLKNRVDEKDNIAYFPCNSWKDLIWNYLSSGCSGNERNKFVIFQLHKQYEFNHFTELFRSCFYSFPFDLIKQAKYQNKNFYLLRFNGKCGDGVSQKSRNDILNHIPDPIYFDGTKVEEIDLAAYLDPSMTSVDDFVSSSGGVYTVGSGMRWFIGPLVEKTEFTGECDLFFFNSLFWPEAKREITLTTEKKAGVTNAVRDLTVKNTSALLKAEGAPLFLIPEVIYTLPGKLYLDGGNPAAGKLKRFQYAIDGIAVMDGKLEATESGILNISVKDLFVDRVSSGSSNIVVGNVSALKKRKVSLLIVNDQISKGFELDKHLRPSISPASMIEKITLPRLTLYSQKDISVTHDFFSTKKIEKTRALKPEFIIISAFAERILRNDYYPLRPGEFEKYSDEIINGFRQIFPSVPIAILIPPAPAANCRFPHGRSGNLCRLAHYQIGKRLLDKYKGRMEEKLYVVPLVFALNQQTDFVFFNSSEAIHTSPYLLNDSGKDKLGNVVAAWMASCCPSAAKNQ